MNYYNEFDPYAAQWLRNLIDAGHLPKGEVDSRSIKDVKASELAGFVQCHFFAGLGGWSYALRLAGWPEDRPVWTGSCPCQPFSAAGAGGGVTDERHLWPTWFNLIRECRPDVIFGEQVEAAINHGWLDLVQTDLEGEGYACGAVGLPAGGVGAPHIRQRLYFVAESELSGRETRNTITRRTESRSEPSTQCGATGELADADSGRHDGWASATGQQEGASTKLANGGASDQLADAQNTERWAERQIDTEAHGRDGLGGRGDVDQLANTVVGGRASKLNARGGNASVSGGEADGQSDCGVDQLADGQREGLEGHAGDVNDRNEPGRVNAQQARSVAPSSWSDCDWLPCRDGKARPVEPGTFPLAHGVSGRVGRLRAYGNAIVPQVAQAFIEAYLQQKRTPAQGGGQGSTDGDR